MRSVALGCGLLFGVFAHASFDMMLIANGGDNRIYRYDPENNVAPGSFSVTGPMYDIVAAQPLNEVYVLSRNINGAAAIIRHDYNTGAYKGVVNLGGSFGTPRKVTMTGLGELLVSYDRDVVRYNPLTGAQIGTSLFYSDRTFFYSGGAAFLANGRYTLVGETDGSVWTNDFMMTFTSSNVQTQSLVASTSASLHSYTDITANASGSAMILSEVLNANNIMYRLYNASTTGVELTNISLNLGGTGLTANGSEWGHAGRAYMIYHGSVNGNLSVIPFDTNLGQFGQSQVVSGFTNATNFYRGSAMIVAPEPGSLLAFVAGAAMLLRRRARSAATP